jgi:hypothetical protein
MIIEHSIDGRWPTKGILRMGRIRVQDRDFSGFHLVVQYAPKRRFCIFITRSAIDREMGTVYRSLKHGLPGFNVRIVFNVRWVRAYG